MKLKSFQSDSKQLNFQQVELMKFRFHTLNPVQRFSKSSFRSKILLVKSDPSHRSNMSAVTLIVIGFLICPAVIAQKRFSQYQQYVGRPVNYPQHIDRTDTRPLLPPLAADDDLNQVLDAFDEHLDERAGDILKEFDKWMVEEDKKEIAARPFDADMEGFVDQNI